MCQQEAILVMYCCRLSQLINVWDYCALHTDALQALPVSNAGGQVREELLHMSVPLCQLQTQQTVCLTPHSGETILVWQNVLPVL